MSLHCLHYKLIEGGWDPYKGWHQMEFRSRENVLNFLASFSHAHRIVILKKRTIDGPLTATQQIGWL